MRKTVFLIGPRGSGKTTVGNLLAQQLGYGFVDTDNALQEAIGTSIAHLVEKEGWSAFRKKEKETLRRVTADRMVIATGGGIVLAEENRQFMQENGFVMYIDVPVAILTERLQKNPNEASRPSLTGQGLLEEIQEIMQEREALYREVAHYCFAGDEEPTNVAELMAHLFLATLEKGEE